MEDYFKELENSIYSALSTYSNVHRGSGYNSLVSTRLFEQARSIVLDYLGLKRGKYVVIFLSPRGAEALMAKLKKEYYYCISSHEIGLPLGLRALAVRRRTLPKGAPFQTGGGTTTLVSPEWVIWAKAPDKFEAGTPSVINVIAFARALCMIKLYGKDIFLNPIADKLTSKDVLHHDELENFSGKELLNELRKRMIGRDIRVPTIEGTRSYTNLDNSASTPTFMPIWNAVHQTWQQPKKVQQDIITEARSICAQALGASLTDYDLIFTSNATEAINLAAESLSRESYQGEDPVILSTLIEHTSNDLPWRMIPSFSLVRLPVDTEGFLDLNELEKILSAYNNKGEYGKKRIKLMAMSGASNVLGTINNLKAISQIVHKYGALLFVDAAQLVAHRKIDMVELGIDYLAFSAHKVYAPFGTGVLIVKNGLLNFNPAEMEQIKSSGEENSGGIAALGKTLLLIQRIGFDIIREEEQKLTSRALSGLAQTNGITIYGISDPASPMFAQKGGVIVFTLKGFMSDQVARELALRGGIGIRYGCHCAHILVKHILGVPPFLERFQRIIAILFPHLRFPGVARVSFGIQNNEDDVDTLISVLGSITKKSVLAKGDVERQINQFVVTASKKVYPEPGNQII